MSNCYEVLFYKLELLGIYYYCYLDITIPYRMTTNVTADNMVSDAYSFY